MSPFKVRMTVEVMGSPKDHIEAAMLSVIKQLKDDKELTIELANVYECTQMENTLWSTFADVEFSAKTLKKVLDVGYDYVPSTMEILEPVEMAVQMKDVEEFLNDFLARIHKFSAVLKKLQGENIYMLGELDRIKSSVRVPINTTKADEEKS